MVRSHTPQPHNRTTSRRDRRLVRQLPLEQHTPRTVGYLHRTSTMPRLPIRRLLRSLSILAAACLAWKALQFAPVYGKEREAMTCAILMMWCIIAEIALLPRYA